MSAASRRVWIALGSNIGDRARALADASERLAALPQLQVIASTAPVETAPLGGLSQPHYLNAMALVQWDGPPEELLSACQAIESAGGRKRQGHWQSRSIDLDLVRVEDLLCDLPGLTLPHPGLRDREFWATSMVELETNG